MSSAGVSRTEQKERTRRAILDAALTLAEDGGLAALSLRQVAKEIGIVPIRSILTHLFETGYGRPTALIYWARNPGWLVYDADFRSLARRYPGFSYLPVLREPPPTWRGEKGEPAEAVDRLVFGVDKLIVYVCGGGETVNRVRDTLVKKGMDRKSVKWEKFW